jgi:hypothetical protein
MTPSLSSICTATSEPWARTSKEGAFEVRDQVIRLPLFVVGSRLNLADVAVQAIGDGRQERCVARVQNGNLK